MLVHHCYLCSSLTAGHTSPPILHTRLVFLLHDCATRIDRAEALAQHYSKREHTTQSWVRQQSGLPAAREPEERALTVVTVVSCSRDKLGSGFQRSREAEPPLPRWCCSRDADTAAGRTPAAAPGQRPPRPPRSAPSHDTTRGGDGKEGREGPSSPCGPGTARSPGARPSPRLGTASAALPAAPRSPSASAEETKVKSPLLGA